MSIYRRAFHSYRRPPRPWLGTKIAPQFVTSGTIGTSVALHAPTTAYRIATPIIGSVRHASTSDLASSDLLRASGYTPLENTLGAPSLSYTIIITAGTIAAASTATAPENISYTQFVTAATIPTTAVATAPTTIKLRVLAAAIASTLLVFEPSAALRLTSGTISATDQRYQPTVAFTIAGATIGAGNLFSPSVAHRFTAATISTTQVVNEPTVAPVIAGATIGAADQRFEPTVAVTLTSGTIETTELLYQPSLFASQQITSGTISTTQALYQPTIATVIAGATVGASNQRFEPTVAVRITTGTIGTSVQFYPPSTLAVQQVTSGTIAASSAATAPIQVNYTITSAFKDTAATISAPAVAVVVSASTITPLSAATAPSLVALQVSGATLAAGSQPHAPTSVITELSIVGAFIPSIGALTSPTDVFAYVPVPPVSLVDGGTWYPQGIGTIVEAVGDESDATYMTSGATTPDPITLQMPSLNTPTTTVRVEITLKAGA